MIAQDDELDAILGELTVLESQFDQVSKKAKLILDPDPSGSGRLRVDRVRSRRIWTDLGGSDQIRSNTVRSD